MFIPNLKNRSTIPAVPAAVVSAAVIQPRETRESSAAAVASTAAAVASLPAAAAVVPAVSVPAVRPAVPVVRVSAAVVPVPRAPDPVPVPAAAAAVRIESIETLQPLRGTGRSGDFVHNTQTMDKEFRNVSTGWTGRLQDPDDKSVMTYDDTLNHISDLCGSTEDIRTDYANLTAEIVNGRFAMVDKRSGRVFELSENALNQFAERAKIGRTLPRRLVDGDSADLETLQIVARNGLRKIDNKPVLLRVRDNSTIRAFLSEEYASIDHSWFLNVVRRIIPGGLVSHFRSDESADNVWFNVLIPDSLRAESDSEYGGMLACGNGETGLNRLHSMPSIFRAICMNGCIWDREDGIAFVDQVHRGEIDLHVLEANIRENLTRQIPLLSSGIDSMLSTKRITAEPQAQPLLILGAVLQTLDVSAITRPAADVIFAKYGEQRTETSRVSAFDIVQGMTAAAQEFSGGLQEITERAAGSAMLWEPEQWGTVFSAAGRLKEKQLKRIFQASL